MNNAYVARTVMMKVDIKKGLTLYFGRLTDRAAGILAS
jgi:hypothetical protein